MSETAVTSETERICKNCQAPKKLIEDFARCKTGYRGYQTQCKLCLKIKAVESRQEKKLARVEEEKRIKKRVKNMAQFEYEDGYKLTANVVGGREGISIRLTSEQDDYAIILPPLIAKSFGEWLTYTVTNSFKENRL